MRIFIGFTLGAFLLIFFSPGMNRPEHWLKLTRQYDNWSMLDSQSRQCHKIGALSNLGMGRFAVGLYRQE